MDGREGPSEAVAIEAALTAAPPDTTKPAAAVATGSSDPWARC